MRGDTDRAPTVREQPKPLPMHPLFKQRPPEVSGHWEERRADRQAQLKDLLARYLRACVWRACVAPSADGSNHIIDELQAAAGTSGAYISTPHQV